jgi:hypothetical protein
MRTMLHFYTVRSADLREREEVIETPVISNATVGIGALAEAEILKRLKVGEVADLRTFRFNY